MAISLAKLTRPDPGAALLRERLFSKLDEARKSSVVWISAPAGAGKTTLISSYIQTRDLKELWYQVDAGATWLVFFITSVRPSIMPPVRVKNACLNPRIPVGYSGVYP